MKLDNGRYEVLFTDGSSMGQFAVYNDEIVALEGDFVKHILTLGPLSGTMNMFRLETTLHNGYYRVQKIF